MSNTFLFWKGRVALYAILTYLAAARTINFIIEGVEEYTGITIISDESEKIRLMITEELGRVRAVVQGAECRYRMCKFPRFRTGEQERFSLIVS